jgi:hypothetical protein
MMKTFLLVLDSTAETDNNEIRHFLNARDEITDWIALNFSTVFLRSTFAHSYQLQMSFQTYLAKNNTMIPNHVIVEFATATPGTTGALPRAVWEKLYEWEGKAINWDTGAVVARLNA